jgi:thiamine-phosphate pyrophosphorylase
VRAEAGDDVRLLKTCDRLHNLSEMHLSPDEVKLTKYVDETLVHVVPLAAGAKRGAAGLVAALLDAVRAACRAQQRAPPAAAALPSTRVPVGVYAIVGDASPQRLQALLHGGAALIQLRAKGRTDREILAMLDAMLPLCRRANVPLIVNDRADLCAAVGASGVHVGLGDLPPHLARRIVGDAALIGTSTHTEPDLHAAAADGAADHLAVGPVFASMTKTDHAPVVGLAALARRAALTAMPVVAVGGITSPARAGLRARAGARLVAAIGALDVDDAGAVCRRMSLAFFAARAMSGGDAEEAGRA